jgi:hypothetical protein
MPIIGKDADGRQLPDGAIYDFDCHLVTTALVKSDAWTGTGWIGLATPTPMIGEVLFPPPRA